MLKNIRKLRNDAGISQRTLAEAVGVSQQAINKYENHNIEPDILTLSRIADYFGTSVDYVIGRDKKQTDDASAPSVCISDENLLSMFSGLSAKEKESILLVMQNYLD